MEQRLLQIVRPEESGNHFFKSTRTKGKKATVERPMVASCFTLTAGGKISYTYFIYIGLTSRGIGVCLRSQVVF